MKRIRVTPEMANEWLDSQAANRNPSQTVISRYARAMQESLWIADPRMPLSFNEDGKLVDGQHRLFAVIEYGKPVEFFTTVISPKILDLVHECKHRSIADRLVLSGAYTPGEAKAVASLGVVLTERLQMGHLAVSLRRTSLTQNTYRPEEMQEAFELVGCDPVQVCKEARSLYNLQPTKFRLIGYTIIGYLLAQKAPKVSAFLNEVVADEHPNRCASANTFRRQLGNTNYSNSHRLALLARAYNNQSAKVLRADDEVEDLDGGCFPIL